MPKSPSIVEAVQAVYTALQDLDANDRAKVLASASALLGMQNPTVAIESSNIARSVVRPAPSDTRPKSLVELIQEKGPKNNTQLIALFAYYREKHEQQTRFARGDLRDYFARARETPAANYDRDFTNAVKAGWIHEADENSYLTSRGLEAVESGFSTVASASKRSKKAARRPK